MAKKQTKKKAPATKLRATFGSPKNGKSQLDLDEDEREEADEDEDEQDDDFDDEEDDEGGEEESEEPSDSEGLAEAEEGIGYDVFDNFARPLAEKGTPVYFLLYRNGAVLGRRDMPYTLERLKQELKHGVVNVICKDARTHRILKKQLVTLSIDAPEVEVPAAQASAPQAPAQNGLGITDLLGLLTKEREGARQEAKDQTGFQANSITTLMTLMMQSQQQAQASQQQSLVQMQQMTSAMIEKSNQSTAEMFKMMQQQMQAIVTNLDKKSGLNDPLVLLKLMQESEQRGIERMKEMIELQDDRESAKSELQLEIEKLRMEMQKDKPEESGLDKLIGALTPVLAMASAAQANSAALPPPQAQAAAAPRAVPGVGAVRTAQAPLAGVMPRAPEPVQPAKKAKKPEVVPAREVKDVQAQEGEVIEMRQKKEEQRAAQAEDRMAQIESVLTPHLGQWMMKRTKVEDAAQATLTILADQGIARKEVLASFSEAKLLQLRQQYGLPALADQWLKPYWAALEPLLKGGAA